jgi:PIN domain nuclease of toxin-antitoxin system
VTPTISEPVPLLLDTHIWIWLEAGSDELSEPTRREISRALGAGQLRIAAISLWELALLVSRSRVTLGKPVSLWIEAALADPGPVIEPLDMHVAVESAELPGSFHRDPADRLIVATARVTAATLMTRDRRILDYAALGHVMAIAA